MNDQKAKSDAGKPKLTLVPRQIIWDIAEVREYGNNKYPEGGPDNWKQVSVDRYRDAAYRHFMAYLDDPKGVDTESGIQHLKHLACNIAFLCALEAQDEGKHKPGSCATCVNYVVEEDWCNLHQNVRISSERCEHYFMKP